MRVQRIPTTGFASNCWVIEDEKTKTAAIVDPSASCRQILDFLQSAALIPKMILLTHGHFDHLYAVDALRDQFPIPAVIHKMDAENLTDPLRNASAYLLHTNSVYRPAEMLLCGNEKLLLGETEIEVLHTPGHTPGCVCYRIREHLFTGDTLFDGSIGRTDLPGGDMDDMQRSLTFLKSLPGQTKIYPGHGNISTIAKQIQWNPYL